MKPSNRSSGDSEDRKFMKMAIKLASKGAGFVSPNPLVGAVIVKNGRIVGRGYHEKFGGPHAEVNALKDAGSEAHDASMYVTLEPCNHHGKTPPCTEAILKAGIRRVVIAMEDPNPDVKGGGAQLLEKQGVEVVCGVLEEECRRQNEFFLKYVKEKMPFVIAKIAATLDGKTATAQGDSKWITGEKSRRLVHTLRHQVAAILVGIETVIADDPMLNVRLRKRKVSHPARFVFDFYGRTPLDSKIVKTANDIPSYLVVGPDIPDKEVDKFRVRGVHVWKTDGKDGFIYPGDFLTRLAEEGFDSLLVEGGSAVHGSFFDKKLVDKIYFFYAPRVLGGDRAKPMIGGQGMLTMKDALDVRELKFRRIAEDFLFTGYIK